MIEKCVSGETVFRGRLLDVRRDQVELPDESLSVREYIRHPGTVLVVPLFSRERILFLRQYRYALGQVFIELPAGKMDPGEHAVETAQRELTEETGYTCEHLERLGVIYPCIGYSDERIEIYMAQGLQPAEAEGEHDEFVEPFEMGLEKALEWIRQGKITDTKTIIALYWMERYLAGEWKPEI